MISQVISHPMQIKDTKEIKISVIVPTYNEKENLIQFVNEVKANMGKKVNYEIIVVDDNSPDGTGEIADDLSMKNNSIKVIHRPQKMGLSSAIIDGLKVSDGEYIIVSDGDLQHSPTLFREFQNEIQNGFDLVIASRYIQGAKIDGWSLFRRSISMGATLFAHLLIPETRKINDPLSGYFIFKKSLIESTNLSGIGWKFLLELIANSRFEKNIEVPYIFKIRTNGKSKLKLSDYMDYLKLIFFLISNSSNKKIQKTSKDINYS